MLKIVIPGNPISKLRHRCGCRGKYPVAYDPQSKGEMQTVRKQISKIYNSFFDNPSTWNAEEAHLLAHSDHFIVNLNFYMSINKSEALGQKNAKLWGLIPCNEKPDFDNLAKFYVDAANGILWPDDKMIVCGTSHKVRYSNNPRTEIIVEGNKHNKLDNEDMMIFKILSPNDVLDLAMVCSRLSRYVSNADDFFVDDSGNLSTTLLQDLADMLKDLCKFAPALTKISKLKCAA